MCAGGVHRLLYVRSGGGMHVHVLLLSSTCGAVRLPACVHVKYTSASQLPQMGHPPAEMKWHIPDRPRPPQPPRQAAASPYMCAARVHTTTGAGH